MSEFEQELERISALIVPYLCERTGLTHEQVVQVLDAQQAFWDAQPHVIGQMTIFGFDVTDEEENAG